MARMGAKKGREHSIMNTECQSLVLSPMTSRQPSSAKIKTFYRLASRQISNRRRPHAQLVADERGAWTHGHRAQLSSSTLGLAQAFSK
jgi:hypothetical protein